jgi:hypothetical protein
MSTAPPGGNGTTSRSGLLGQLPDCAHAGVCNPKSENSALRTISADSWFECGMEFLLRDVRTA